MGHPTIYRNLMGAICLACLVFLNGCASGGGSRGRLSDASTQASAQASTQDKPQGRGQGRTRTKTEVNQPEQYEDFYQEEESGGGFGFIGGLVASLFQKDDEPEEYDPYDYPDISGAGATIPEFKVWTDQDEFGLDPLEDNPDEDYGQEAGGGGIDITGGNLNFWYSRSQVAGDAIENFNTYTLMYSGYLGPRIRAHAGLYYGRGNKGTQPAIQDEIRWISEAGLDLGIRGYFTTEYSLLGFYWITGLRAGALYWSYIYPLLVSDEDQGLLEISHDGVAILTPYAGLGTSLFQTKRVHVGVSFTAGARFAVGPTYEDFVNDLFVSTGEFKLNFEASFFF